MKIETSIVSALKRYSVISNVYCVQDRNFFPRWCRVKIIVAIEGNNILAYAGYVFFCNASDMYLHTCTSMRHQIKHFIDV